jgi:hypothetical protein
LGAALFYGGSTYASLKNPTYADFFTEKVPGGDACVDFVERTPWARSVRSTDVGDVPQRAVNAASATYDRVSGALQRVMGETKEKTEDLKKSGKDVEKKGQDLIAEGRRTAKSMVSKVEKKVEDADVKGKGQDVASDIKAKSQKLVDNAIKPRVR